MPIWNGKSIPFDPEIIAGLLFRGEEITSDEGISDQQLEYERSLIDEHLQKLWGDQKSKALDESQPNISRNLLKRREEILGEKPNPKDDKTVMGRENETINFKQVVPNPFLEQNMPMIKKKTYRS